MKRLQTLLSTFQLAPLHLAPVHILLLRLTLTTVHLLLLLGRAVLVEREIEVSACMRRHQAFALATVAVQVDIIKTRDESACGFSA